MNSNFDFWWREFGLEKTQDVLLWLMYHEKRYEVADLQKLPIWNKAKHIFLIDQEIIEHDISDPRVHLWAPTISNHPRIHTYSWWHDRVQHLELELNFTEKLLPYTNKTPLYKFDALLGTLRKHKTVILEKIQKSKLEDSFILGALGTLPNHQNNPNWISGGEFDPVKFHPYPQINGKSIDPNLLSCILPYKIYNDSWYSLVCETTGSDIRMYSEKTAKPLLGKRIFVLVGAKHHLKGLHAMGYKTFDSIIDESYDNIDDDQTRWEAAWNQVEHLLELNPAKTYNQVQDILEHNYNTFMNKNWMEIVKQDIWKIINEEI